MEALIGAIIGAVAALVGSWVTTLLSTRAEIKTAALSVILPARLDAYRQFETAIEEWSKSKTRETLAAVYRAGNMVALVSSDKTTADLSRVLDHIRTFEMTGIPVDLEQFQLARAKLLVSMNYDLKNISIPTIKQSDNKIKDTKKKPKVKKNSGSSIQSS